MDQLKQVIIKTQIYLRKLVTTNLCLGIQKIIFLLGVKILHYCHSQKFCNITRFKPKKDVFRRILKNDDLGEYLYIIRDEKNSVTGFKRHQNIYTFYGKNVSDLN